MVLNFKAIKTAQASAPLKPLFCIILGSSGSGKSSTLGTTGVPTLLLHGLTEAHAGTAARARGGDCVSVDFTVRRADSTVDYDATYKNLQDIIKQGDIKDHFGAIAIDSVTELQQIVRGTAKWKQLCLTDKGTHNSFKEGESDIKMIKEIIDQLIVLHEAGLMVFVTCAAVTKSLEDDGSVSECTPSLLGFSVAHDVIRNFADILLVSRITEENEAGDFKPSHKFIFKSNISKVSKDLKGNVLKTQNFSPRISGMTLEQLPETCVADIAKVVAGRNKKLTK